LGVHASSFEQPAGQIDLLDDIADEQREMSARAGSTVIEVAGSHAIYVSQPAAVADLIKAAVIATIPVAVGA